MLQIFNATSMQKETFEPLQNPYVRIFICGPTVYDYSHIGHARVFVVYDVIARYLRAKGYRPFVLVNITDIDAKIFERARNEHTSYDRIVARYMGELQKDLTLLNTRVDSFAMGSDYIEQAKESIDFLLREGYAYSTNGNVYFDVAKAKDYGVLSHQSRDDMLIRPVDLAPNKRNKYDFLVWNGRDEFGARWKSNFGSGIPWWHIQDTSVAVSNFHSGYDIHGGARELLYPHHEAHLAQMKAITKLDMPVKYWVHTGLVNVDGQKMSKSLGNMVTIRDAVSRHGSDALRLYLLSKHYSEDLDIAESELPSFREKILLLRDALAVLRDSNAVPLDNAAKVLADGFYASMDDNFNTVQALKYMYALAEGVLSGSIKRSTELYGHIRNMWSILGLTL